MAGALGPLRHRGRQQPDAYRQIDHELEHDRQAAASRATSWSVYDIVKFCRRQQHLLPGPRARRPTPAVCYALWITNVDAVRHGLLFERFLAPERDGPPDIDVDIESDQREEVIQHVYDEVRPAATPPRSPT